MTKREKTLGWMFGALFVAIVGTSVTVGAFRKIGSMKTQSQQLADRVVEIESIIKSRALWEQRSGWIAENVPQFETRGKASTELISRIDAASQQTGVIVEGKELIAAPTEEELEVEGGFYDSAGMKITVTGSEQSVVKWIHALQQPSSFTGVSGVVLEKTGDGTGLNCEAEVRLWYQ